eukprot:scaffold50681_cov20-Prasinocladus_malaysianus.AAC.1
MTQQRSQQASAAAAGRRDDDEDAIIAEGGGDTAVAEGKRCRPSSPAPCVIYRDAIAIFANERTHVHFDSTASVSSMVVRLMH